MFSHRAKMQLHFATCTWLAFHASLFLPSTTNRSFWTRRTLPSSRQSYNVLPHNSLLALFWKMWKVYSESWAKLHRCSGLAATPLSTNSWILPGLGSHCCDHDITLWGSERMWLPSAKDRQSKWLTGFGLQHRRTALEHFCRSACYQMIILWCVMLNLAGENDGRKLLQQGSQIHLAGPNGKRSTQHTCTKAALDRAWLHAHPIGCFCICLGKEISG